MVGSAAVPQLGAAPTAQPAQLSPGINPQTAGVDSSDSKTFRAIMDFASGALAPKVKEAAQAQFIQGVQQAMTGASLEEIQRDKPWYTDIFAPSSALAGARTFTAQRAIAEWGGKMQEQMPALAKVGPEQLQSAAVGALQGFMTGDAQADGMITSAVVEQMAPLFKQHAKEHYIYVQKQASDAQVGAWEAQGRVYQGVAASAATGKGVVTPEDHEAAKSRFLTSIAPFADQSDESFERNIASFLEGSASAGNFQVVKLFKETGLYDKIAPDKRATLDRSLKVFGRETLNNAMPQFAVDVATLVNDMTQDPHSILPKVAALNARAAAATGVSEAELIPASSLDNIIGRVMVAQEHEAAARAKAAQTAAEKDAEKVGEVALAATQLQRGAGFLDACVTMGLCKEHAAEKAGAIAYAAAKTPAERAAVLNGRTLKPFEGIKSAFGATFRSPEFQAGVGDMAQVYKGMSEDVKTRYFDENERGTMDRFLSMVGANTPPEAAWVTAKVAASIAANAIGTTPHDEVAKAIRAEVESQNQNLFHINNVDDASLRLLEAASMKTYKLDRTNNPPDVAAKRAYAQARAGGVDIQGKHAMVKANPDDRPLFALVGESVQGTAEAFEELMAERAKAQGVKLDAYLTVRVPDRNGKALIQVTADQDGRIVPWTISSDEIKERVVAKTRKQMQHPVGLPPSAPIVGPEGAAFGVVPRP